MFLLYLSSITPIFVLILDQQEHHMRIHYKYFPPEIKALYMIDSLIDSDRYVYVDINKGMYGLKQAAVIAYQQLVKHIDVHGYYPIQFTTGLWSHQTLKTTFCLCVDDFGIKFFSQKDANNFLTTLRHKYNVTVEWTGEHSTCVGHIGVSWEQDGLGGSETLGCTQASIYRHALFYIPNQYLYRGNSHLSSPP